MTIKIKKLFYYAAIFLFSCSPLTHSSLLTFPAPGFKLDDRTLKTNGYFFCEKERTAYCKYIPGTTTGVMADTLTKYSQKYISAFFLYTDGYAYFTGNLITSGVTRTGATSSNDHCNLVREFNTFNASRSSFEEHVINNRIGKNHLHDKGIYKINRDTISFQIYESGSHPLVFIEYLGIILNDTTFKLIKEVRQQNRFPRRKPLIQDLNHLYHFKKYSVKPDSTNYLRNNRLKLEK